MSELDCHEFSKNIIIIGKSNTLLALLGKLFISGI